MGYSTGAGDDQSILVTMLNILIDPSSERKLVDFRSMGFRDVLALGRSSYASAHKPLESHSHGNMYEICYLDAGTQPYISNGKEYCLKGGDVFVSLPNEIHGSGTNPLGRGRLYWMLIRVPSSRDRFLNLPPAAGRQLVQSFLDIPARHFKGRHLLKYYLENIFRIHDHPSTPMRTAELKNWMLRFLLDVLADAVLHEENRASSPIAKVQRFIDEHLYDPAPTLEELAGMVNLSLSRFKVRFKDEVGLAPGGYIMMRKVEEAGKMLRNPERSITDIAFALHFSSSQYFSTTFKRYTGITPRRFQEQSN